MLNHPTGLFSGDYNSALKGCWPLKFVHNLQLPKMYFKSDMGHRAVSCWTLPHISKFILFYSFFLISQWTSELTRPIATKLYHVITIYTD